MYKLVVGLEVHAELKTNSKIFSSAKNSYSEVPNTNVVLADLSFPGILPVLNKEAVFVALKAAIALNCNIADFMIFDRKSYFYPDLPKGYQLTQNTRPIGIDGHLMINVDGLDKKVIIHDVHLEEDTASLDHFAGFSLINYNRAGIPLIEIVTTPCLHSVEEVITFLESLRSLLLYCDISEASSDKGQMRCDVNISLADNDMKYLTKRVEVKNLNSFNNVKDAILYEVKRLTGLLEEGVETFQETRRFDDDKRKTFSMRTKVTEVDYRYFVDPNIPIFKISDELRSKALSSIPKLQYERINHYMDVCSLSRYDAEVLVKDKSIADFFEKVVSLNVEPKLASNWVSGVVLGHLNRYELSIGDLFIKPEHIRDLINLVSSNKISIKQAKEVFYKSVQSNKDPLSIVSELDIKQISNEDFLSEVVAKVVESNQNLIEEYRKGKNVFDYFIGQIMKETKGQANPKEVVDLVEKEFEKY